MNNDDVIIIEDSIDQNVLSILPNDNVGAYSVYMNKDVWLWPWTKIDSIFTVTAPRNYVMLCVDDSGTSHIATVNAKNAFRISNDNLLLPKKKHKGEHVFDIIFLKSFDCNILTA